MARNRLGRLAASLFVVGAIAVSVAGCVLVPVPAPVAGPPVIVAPRPVFVPRPVYGYGYYRPYYGRGYGWGDRKSTRLNSSHANISYAVFCLKKKNIINPSEAAVTMSSC